MQPTTKPPHRIGFQFLLLFSLCATICLESAAAEKATTPSPPTKGIAAPSTVSVNSSFLYDVDFRGGTIEEFVSFWKTNVPSKDSFIILEEVKHNRLPAFQVQAVHIEEIARSIEFLGREALAVQVVETRSNPGGNLWRIGPRRVNGGPRIVMKAIAAPRIFNKGDKMIDSITDAVRILDQQNQMKIVELRPRYGIQNNDEVGAEVVALRDQRVFVVRGGENAVAGIESFIQAAEKAAPPTLSELEHR